MYELIQAVLLGAIQGVAEFLPISSSGHLVIGHALIDAVTGTKSSGEENIAFDIALHVGTLGSIFVVFWSTILEAIRQPRIAALVILATIPAAFVGLLFKSRIEQTFESPLFVGCCLLVTAALLFASQSAKRDRFTLADIPWGIAFAIGCFQAVAILPGISRAGSTICGALLLGTKRDAAGRFSFLMAIPAIAGAAVLQVKDVLKSETVDLNWGALVLGTLVSFVVGIFALKALMVLIQRQKLHYFAYYCLVVGLATIAWQLSVRG